MGSLCSLSDETLLLILDLLAFEQLKVLRTVCRRLQLLTEPLLYREMLVYPHSSSLDAALNVSKHASLRLFVRRVTIDCRWVNLARAIHARISSVWDIRTPKKRKQEILRVVSNFIDNTLTSDTMSTDDLTHNADKGCAREWLTHSLSQCLSRLPYVASVHLWDSNYDTGFIPAALPEFYQKLRRRTCGALANADLEPGVHLLRGTPWASLAVIFALLVSPSPLHELHLVTIPERDFVFMHAPVVGMVKRIFYQLRKLQILLVSSSKHITRAPRVIGRCLADSKSLEDLHIQLGDQFVPAVDTPLQEEKLSEIRAVFLSPPLTLPKVRRLRLEGFSSTVNDMMHLLQHICGALRQLHIGDLTLLRSADSEKRPCLVRLIKLMSSELRLDSMKFSEGLNNSGLQLWNITKITDSNNPDTMLSRVERFVVEKTEPCPLEEWAIQPDQVDSVFPEGFDHEAWHYVDESWKMECTCGDLDVYTPSAMEQEEDDDLSDHPPLSGSEDGWSSVPAHMAYLFYSSDEEAQDASDLAEHTTNYQY